MSDNGKGSQRRGTSREEQDRYTEGWNRIFNAKAFARKLKRRRKGGTR